MPADKPDDMDAPAFSPRQLAQLDERFAQLDKRFDRYMTREETHETFAHFARVIAEQVLSQVKVMLEPIQAKLEELTTVKPRVDTLVAAELPSRLDRLERKVFPARSRRAPAKRSRSRRG